MPGHSANHPRRRGRLPVVVAAALGAAPTRHVQSILERHTFVAIRNSWNLSFGLLQKRISKYEARILPLLYQGG